LWWSLAAIEALCVLEVLLGNRYRFRSPVISWLEGQGWYATRATMQIGLLVVSLAAVAACLVPVARRCRDDASTLTALLGTATSAALFVVETISLHPIDSIFYAQLGSVGVLALLWASASLVVVAAALRSHPSRPLVARPP
jgi:hypothetical protein